MHSNQQPALMGASVLHFSVSENSVGVRATLGGVTTMKKFIYLFPPILVASLLIMTSFLQPAFFPWHILWVLLWAGVALFIGRSFERTTNQAIDRLVRAMAQAK